MAALFEAADDERFEQDQSHFLRQTALVQFQLRTDNDHGTTRVVDSFTQQVLTETTLLTAEHVTQRFQRAVTGTDDRTTVTTVVEQRIYRLLQHAPEYRSAFSNDCCG